MVPKKKNLTLPRFICLLGLLTIMVVSATAQTAILPPPQPGEKGVYVFLGVTIPGREFNTDIASYKIERKTEIKNQWESLGTVSAPGSLDEFNRRLHSFHSFLPDFPLPASDKSEELWQKAVKIGRIDSLFYWGGMPVVNLAFGTMFLDTNVTPGQRILYRVTGLKADGSVKESIQTDRVEYLPVAPYLAPELLLAEGSFNNIRLKFKTTGKQIPSAFRVLKQNNLTGDFNPVHSGNEIAMQKNSAILIITDTLVEPNHIYTYKVIPLDLYGNHGKPSKEISVGSYDFEQAAYPLSFSTQNNPEQAGIRLNWEYPYPSLIKYVSIFRSEEFDGKYLKIADADPAAGSWLDQSVVPMKKYYYYLQATGPLEEQSNPGTKVPAMLQSTEPPLPPVGLTAETIKNGIRLSWTANGRHLKGFYVYRNDGTDTEFRLVSPLIPAGKDSLPVSWEDTGKELSGARIYSYYVQAENTSHVPGLFSDTVGARPGIPTKPIAPIKLQLNREANSYTLHWMDMSKLDPTVTGYRVFFRTVNGKNGKPSEWKSVSDSVQSLNKNYFHGTIEASKTMELAVRSYDFFGGVSDFSEVKRIDPITQPPTPPAVVYANPTKEGVLLNWTYGNIDQVSAFALYRYQRGRDPILIKRLSPHTEMVYTDKTVHSGELYFYYVITIDSNQHQSFPSREVGIRMPE
ncbi:MAG: hypothetical protein Kow00108_16230 [Calditrichia bacterium]